MNVGRWVPVQYAYFLHALSVAIALSCAAGGPLSKAAESRLDVRILDEEGQLLPARGWVEAQGERLYQPFEPKTVTAYQQDQSFSCDGRFAISVPAGKVIVHVEKGKEFLPTKLEIEIPEGQSVRQDVRLDRWINMAEEGWYSADLHVHLGFDSPRVLSQLALADDINLIPSFTYWLRGNEESWKSHWPDDTYLSPISVDATHLITRNNIEIERIERTAETAAAVGATFLFNLQQPVSVAKFDEHFPTDAELCRLARHQSNFTVFDSDKPSWAETVIGAALGQLDTIQVCHNHYNRSRTLPGGWGMVGPLAPGESNWATGDGLFHRTNGLYYRLLNCGFRLGVSGGSAIGVMPAPTGFSRLYAKLDGPYTAESMWKAIKAGRTFATSGPMLGLSANGLGIGDTLNLSSSGARRIRIEARVQSIGQLEALEVIHDGLVVAANDLRTVAANPTLDAKLDVAIPINHSGWLAARALYRAPDGLLRQAHTSPIYIKLDGQPVRSHADAQYMLQWIDRLISVAEQHPEWFPDTEARESVMGTYRRAQDVYAAIAGER